MKINKLAPFCDDRGNRLVVEDGTEFRHSSITFSGTGSTVAIGAGAIFSGFEAVIGGSALFRVGSGARLSGVVTVGFRSRVEIGKKLQATGNVALRAVEATSIEIGDDCLCGRDIVVRTTDGHPIYDARTRERLNPAKSVKIGHHVWLADGVAVLKGVEIGNATVVGTRSLVTKSLPANSVCAGSPARVIREGVTWEHAPGIISEEFYL